MFPQEEFETLQKDHEVLGADHTSLLDIHKKIVEQRDSYATQCERMKRSATPRPDWDKCGKSAYRNVGQTTFLDIIEFCDLWNLLGYIDWS